MIAPTLARLLVREHLYKPIQGKVLTLGRQKIAMTYEQVIELLRQEGYMPPQHVLEEMSITHNQKTGVGKGTSYITDEVFFGLLGISDLFSIDVSDYEGADFLADLNLPITKELENRFDFIIDGGTFDHIFNIRQAFANVCLMLKPGGRIIHLDAASNFTGTCYLSFSPSLFFDYYKQNNFTGIKGYIAEVSTRGQTKPWKL